MSYTTAPLSTQDAMVDERRLPSQTTIDWATALITGVDRAPTRLGRSVTVATEAASLGATPFNIGALAQGLYRVSYFARITTPATTSSSLIVGFNFTNGGVGCNVTGTAVTGNTPSSVGSESFPLSIDSSTPISYFTLYESVGATAMQYSLTVIAEQVEA